MGGPHVQTPHIDRLASQSARYVNGYVPSSVCRPSLATLLTGLYPHQHGIYFNHPPPGNAALNRMSRDEYYATRARAELFIRAAPSLPRILAGAGYDCLQTGKYWEGHFRSAGFTHGMTTGRAAGVPGCWDKQLPDGATVAHGNGDIGLTIGRSTMKPLFDFIDQHGGPDDSPFFICYAPVLPHEPHNPAERYLAMYRDRPGIERRLVEYYAACTWFDATVGRLIDYLERKNLAGNTLFLFVVDNGWAPSGKRKSEGGYAVDTRSKRSPFDAGLRTPILIRWDGRVKPASHEALCSSVDIVPTILHALGLGELARGLPGVNLMLSATGRQPLERRAVFGEIYPGDATSLGDPSGDIAYRWVRDGDMKLIMPHRHAGRKPWRGYLSQPALFNVAEDPSEKTNLSGDPKYAKTIARLRRLLDQWWTPTETPNRGGAGGLPASGVLRDAAALADKPPVPPGSSTWRRRAGRQRQQHGKPGTDAEVSAIAD
jgi:uncharacterized sulfatase